MIIKTKNRLVLNRNEKQSEKIPHISVTDSRRGVFLSLLEP